MVCLDGSENSRKALLQAIHFMNVEQDELVCSTSFVNSGNSFTRTNLAVAESCAFFETPCLLWQCCLELFLSPPFTFTLCGSIKLLESCALLSLCVTFLRFAVVFSWQDLDSLPRIQEGRRSKRHFVRSNSHSWKLSQIQEPSCHSILSESHQSWTTWHIGDQWARRYVYLRSSERRQDNAFVGGKSRSFRFEEAVC